MRVARSLFRAPFAGAAAVVLFGATPASAEGPSHDDKIAAESLFEDARALMTAGKVADACPKFADSQRLDPSVATLLNLASCWEKLGRRASAWATYKEAASAANAAGRSDYLAVAQKHADALAPKLARLTLKVTKPVDGLEIQRDGVTVVPAELEVAIPADAGSHVVTATAPGYKPWRSSVDVPADGALVTVNVPPLEANLEPSSSAVAPPVATAAPAAPPAPPAAPVEAHRSGSGQRMAGWTVGGAGVVSVGIGAAFVALASSKNHQSMNGCDSMNLCTRAGLDDRNSARTDGDVATWTIAIGAAAVAAGIVLLVTAPSGEGGRASNGAAIVVAPTLGGAMVSGAW